MDTLVFSYSKDIQRIKCPKVKVSVEKIGLSRYDTQLYFLSSQLIFLINSAKKILAFMVEAVEKRRRKATVKRL